MDMENRHPATREIFQWFSYHHLPEGIMQDTSHSIYLLAKDMIDILPDGPELTTGLRKLLEAKNCFVRQALKSMSMHDTE
jgi:hypothetical protein